MPDHVLHWDDAPDWSTTVLSSGGVTIRGLDLPDQALVSGDLCAFGRLAGLDPNGVGALGLVDGHRYTLRLGRDRLLAVGPLPARVRVGWNLDGFALTPMGGADQVFELSGEGLAAPLSRALTVDPDNPGPSALLVFAGVPACAYWHQPTACLRLHVERGLAAYLWTWLQSLLKEA